MSIDSPASSTAISTSASASSPIVDTPASAPRAISSRPAAGHDIARLASGREQLRALCGGAVHLPGDAGYDAARMPWNLAVDQRPAAVAYPAGPAEVAAVVRAASAAGLTVAAQGTGHNAGPLGDLAGTVLIRTSAMTSVSIDPVARRARVGAGVLWADVVEAAAPHGLAALHGSSPDVGVAGYSLGGGMGWYARRLGLQTNSLTAVELVLADGSLARADATTNPDLFWALRGGGGNFGVVTALEFRLYPIASAYAGVLAWDWTLSERILRTWAEWAVEAPESVTTSLRLLQLPPMPEIPEPFRGRQLVAIDGAVLRDDESAQRILRPLRDLRPEFDTFARVPAASLSRLHMDPEGPTPTVSASSVLDRLPAEAVSAMIETAGPGSGSSLLLTELRQLGGALARPAENAGALPNLDGRFVLFAATLPMTPEMSVRGLADARRAVDAVSPWANGRQYLNFAEHRLDASAGYTAGNWARLRAIRSTVDPHGLFVANHRVPVTTSAATIPAQR